LKPYRAYHFSVYPTDKKAIFSAWLTSFPFESFVNSETGVTAYISLDKAIQISETACLAVPFDGVVATLNIEDFGEQNWNAIWEEHFHPITVGDWTIRASFHKPSSIKNEIIIDPQMSFGTGHHATTQLMLEQLLDIDVADKSVLDVGTGTGVLAIAAKMQGAKKVAGVDIESWCVDNAIENAAKNDMDGITFSTKTLVDFTAFKPDLILANINRNVLLAHLPSYAQTLSPGGSLLLSGFHQKDIAVLYALAQENGLKPLGKTEKEGWICLKFINS
jgi:ribosomal protein L11 methyltransferase